MINSLEPIAPIDFSRTIAFGTQCGAAEATAKKLMRWLRIQNPTVMSLDDAKGLQQVGLKNATHLLCICSTFAHGDPPLNARKFFKQLSQGPLGSRSLFLLWDLRYYALFRLL